MCRDVSGLVQSLGATWGLFRHYGVLVKLLLTILASSSCCCTCSQLAS